jgi:PKD repeat protein
VAPEITSLTAPAGPAALGEQPIAVQVAFSDPGVDDTHDCTFDWGDGTTSTSAADLGECAASHEYASGGIFTITVTVTDDDGAGDSASANVIITDPAAGFVTGGATVLVGEDDVVPAGVAIGDAVRAEFNVRYRQNASTPSGEVNVRIGDLRLRSVSLDWLVVTAGDEAAFSGWGRFERSGPLHAFQIGMVDDDTADGEDRIEVTIWDAEADPTSSEPIYRVEGGVTGGSIQIHR